MMRNDRFPNTIPSSRDKPSRIKTVENTILPVAPESARVWDCRRSFETSDDKINDTPVRVC